MRKQPDSSKDGRDMQGLLVMNEFGQTESFVLLRQALMAAAYRLGMGLTLRTNAALLFDAACGKPLFPAEPYDFCLFWDKDILLGRQLTAGGLRLFNSIDAIEIADDKARTHLCLGAHGLPQPKTIIAPLTFAGLGYNNLHFLTRAGDYLGFPMVIKECHGSFGWQVYLANTWDDAAGILMQHAPSPMILQEFVHERVGEDIRVYVVGGKAIAAIRRQNSRDFRANVSSGGVAESYIPTSEETSLALAAAKALGLDFAGVDLLMGRDGPLLCEVNSNAHFRGLSARTGVDAAEAILLHIRNSVGQ
ncbi:MAG: RimK family alpha-L-glutamate ligase [Clostridia bacterium]|nr:RimK family alpha-L-glutamate ligase [Clostridia bacterium]